MKSAAIFVYFESDTHAEHVATFYSEGAYMDCFPVLEVHAREMGMIVTESIQD